MPTLIQLLADPTFPRRDNVVAFLAHLGGPDATRALVRFLQAPPAALTLPQEDRALLLAPQALGQIARRRDPAAVDVLLEMTEHGANGALLAAAASRAPNPASMRDDLLEMAMRGLGHSGDPRARVRLQAIAARQIRPAVVGRDLRGAASESLRILDGLDAGPPAAAAAGRRRATRRRRRRSRWSSGCGRRGERRRRRRARDRRRRQRHRAHARQRQSAHLCQPSGGGKPDDRRATRSDPRRRVAADGEERLRRGRGVLRGPRTLRGPEDVRQRGRRPRRDRQPRPSSTRCSTTPARASRWCASSTTAGARAPTSSVAPGSAATAWRWCATATSATKGRCGRTSTATTSGSATTPTAATSCTAACAATTSE